MIRALGLAALLMLGTVLPVLGDDVATSLAGNAEQRYQDIAAHIAQLRAATDLESKLELAKLLAGGVPAGPIASGTPRAPSRSSTAPWMVGRPWRRGLSGKLAFTLAA